MHVYAHILVVFAYMYNVSVPTTAYATLPRRTWVEAPSQLSWCILGQRQPTTAFMGSRRLSVTHAFTACVYIPKVLRFRQGPFSLYVLA